jgi:membrane protease YdiL (CAAX protease family)
VEFSLYNTFFAHRNGKLFNDIYLVFAFCIIPPIFEGLIFQGAILNEHNRRGRVTATIFASILFALLGFNFELVFSRFFVCFLLCIVLYATESIATTIAIHIAYNFFAVFLEPTLVSVKSVSSNFELFAFIVAIFTLVIAIFLFSHLSRLYRKYSHDKFGENFIRSTPRARIFWHLVELLTSIPAIVCYLLFIIITLITK